MRIIDGRGFDPSIKGGYGQKAQQNWKEFKGNPDDGGDGGTGSTPPSNPLDGLFGGGGGLGDILGGIFGGMTQPQKPDPVAVQYAQNATSSHKTIDQNMANDVFAFVREEMGEWDKDGQGGLSQSEFSDMVSESMKKDTEKLMNSRANHMKLMQKMIETMMNGGDMGGFGDLFGQGDGLGAPQEDKAPSSSSDIKIPDLVDMDDLNIDLSDLGVQDEPAKADDAPVEEKPAEETKTDDNGPDFSDLFNDLGGDDTPLSDMDLDLSTPADKPADNNPVDGEAGIQDKLQDMLNGNFGNMDPQDMLTKMQELQRKQEIAKAFDLQDLNGDDKIDDTERAAAVLFTDDVVTNTKGVFKANVTSKFDGILQEHEREIANNVLLTSKPKEVTGEIKRRLQAIHSEADLTAKYQQFIQ